MALTIYHNPRCSKSRETLKIINEAGVEPRIVQYLQETPAAAEIVAIAGRLGVGVADLMRRGESEFKNADDLPGLDNDAALADWIAAHPAVLQRPIVVDEASGKAVIGRPPGNVRDLLR